MKAFQTFPFCPDTVISEINDSLRRILIVSTRGAFVKSESASNDVIKQPEF